MGQFFVYEHQVRPDGVVNVMAAVSRSTFALAMSYFYERCSKMSANDQFLSAHVMLVDEGLNVVKREDIVTSYVAPDVESQEGE